MKNDILVYVFLLGFAVGIVVAHNGWHVRFTGWLSATLEETYQQ